jgi:hypothetical protein
MPAVDFRILCNLWSRWNPKRRQCNPGADTIASDCGFDRKTVFPALKRLEKGGWIKRLGKPFGGSNRYLPIVPSHGTIEGLPIVPSHGTPIVPSHGTPVVPPAGTGRYTSEGTQVNDLATGSAVAAETRELLPIPAEPGPKRTTRYPDPNSDPDCKVELVFPEGLKSEAFKAKWAEYVAYRKASNMRRLKPVSVIKKLAELETWGEPAATASIDQTIRNGWQGLFLPKPHFGVTPMPPAKALVRMIPVLSE